uniref:Uncharacterized protein n=1 Tax=Anguilla anguilla TaxID=7936 RepID=A0A0E9PNJ0_ANGAN
MFFKHLEPLHFYRCLKYFCQILKRHLVVHWRQI